MSARQQLVRLPIFSTYLWRHCPIGMERAGLWCGRDEQDRMYKQWKMLALAKLMDVKNAAAFSALVVVFRFGAGGTAAPAFSRIAGVLIVLVGVYLLLA